MAVAEDKFRDLIEEYAKYLLNRVKSISYTAYTPD